MSRPYVYQPLSSPSSTRVPLLQPDKAHNAPLRCALQEITFDVDQTIPYNALSYVWGARTGSLPLFCEDSVKDGTILITPNCNEAFLSLRRQEEEVVTLWVDALCINQQDTKERGQQVTIMAEIY